MNIIIALLKGFGTLLVLSTILVLIFIGFAEAPIITLVVMLIIAAILLSLSMFYK